MTKTMEELIQQNADLQTRLEAAEEALRAIQHGEVDALVVQGETGERIYTLEGADTTYRMLIEGIQEGLATLHPEGMILYANQRLAEMLSVPLENLLGSTLLPYIQPDQQKLLHGMLRKGLTGSSKGELTLHRQDGSVLPVLLSMNFVENMGERIICLAATDLSEQKRQAEILEAERLARSILEQAAEAIVVCDTNGMIIRVSQATEQLVQDNPLFQPFEKVFPLSIVEKEQSEKCFSIHEVSQGSSFHAVETLFPRGNQPDRCLLLSASPLRNEREVIIGCVVTLTDITERKQAEEQLRIFASVVENSSDFIGLCTPEMQPIFVNEKGRQMVGLETMDEAQQTRLMDYFWPEDRELIEREAIPTLKESGRWYGEVRFRHFKTGEPIHTIWGAFVIKNNAGLPVAWATISPNLTQLKQTEQALRDHDERLRLAILTADLGVFEWHIPADQPVWENQRMYEIFGRSPTEGPINASELMQEVIHPEDAPEFERVMTECLAKGGMFRPIIRIRRKNDGKWRWIEYSGQVILDAEGHPQRMVGVLADITERKQAEEAIRQYTLQLEQLNQELEFANGELKDFAYIASHDLQEPLRKVSKFGEMLQDRYGAVLEENGQEYLDRMIDAARRMQEMINGLLDYSRISTRGNPFETVNLAETTQEVLVDLEIRIEHSKGKVELGYLPEIEADPLQIRQLLQNLISNALKFHKPGVPPLVKVWCEDCTEILQKEGCVQIIVQDHGIGFESVLGKKLFQPFMRLHGKSAFEGTGMGLAICRKIAERHGGKIAVESQLGAGTTFTVTLPKRQKIKQAQ